MSHNAKHDACAQPGLMPVDEAIKQICESIQPVTTEIRPLSNAMGYVLAEPVVAGVDVPPADNSSMDGYAIRVADLANGPLGVSQRIAAGDRPQPLQPGTCARIFTGAETPEGADAVVMQEKVTLVDDKAEFPKDTRPGENIRKKGQDINQGKLLLETGTRLDPISLGLIASIGLPEVVVYRKPVVALLSTGNELVEPGLPLQPGQIYNSNRYLLINLFKNLGCEVIDAGIIQDTLAETKSTLARVAEQADLVVTSGGVSVGEEDHVKPAVEALGALNLWRMAMKPGKPLAFGSIRKTQSEGDAYFVGLPGNPVSAFLTSLVVVRPALAKLQGCKTLQNIPYRYAEAEFNAEAGIRREYLRVRRIPSRPGDQPNQATRVELFPNQNSGVLTSCQWADALVVMEPGQKIREGDWVKYLELTSLMATY